MKNSAGMILLFCMLSFASIAQQSTTTHKSKHKHHKTAAPEKPLPTWAKSHNYDATAHVYFPDYHTFYDAGRGGYVFWKDSNWSFTPAMPPYMEKVDMSKERIQILKGLDLDLHPEQNYPNYVKMYPADHENNMVPVPNVLKN